MIDSKIMNDLIARYDYYIPLRGHDKQVAEDKWDYTPDMGVHFAAPLIKAKGRVSRAEKPFAYIFQMNHSAITGSNKNSLNQRMYRLALEDTTGIMTVKDAWYEYIGEEDGVKKWEMRSPEYSTDREQYEQNIEEFEERMQELSEQGLASRKRKGLNVGLFIKPKQAAQHEVHVYVNGDEKVIYINGNPKVARAINGTNLVDQGKALSAVANVSRFMAANFTTRNPLFVASNFARDYIYASTILAVKEDVAYAAKFQKNLVHSAGSLQRYIAGKADVSNKWDNYAVEFIMNGGKTGYSHIVELQKIQKRIEKEIKKNGKVSEGGALLRALSAANEFAENLSRLSVYITSREEGRSIDKSIYDAKEVTVNFNRVGTGAKGNNMVRSFYLFFNVALEAMANITRAGKKSPKKMAALLASFVASGILMPLINGLIGGDDAEEKYKNLTQWERQNNFCIWTGKGFIKIPISQELRVFHALGDNLYQAVSGKTTATEAAVGSLESFTDLLPINPLGAAKSWTEVLPDAVKPIMQISSNKSWTGGRIYNPYASDYDPGHVQSLRNKKGEIFAPAILYDASRALNKATGGNDIEPGVGFNPDIAAHLMKGYFGGLWTMAYQTANITQKVAHRAMGKNAKIKIRETPLRQFYADENDIMENKAGINKQYYGVMDEVRKNEHYIKGYKKEAEQLQKEGADVLDLAKKVSNVYEMNTHKHQILYEIDKRIKYMEGKYDEIEDMDIITVQVERLKILAIEISKLEKKGGHRRNSRPVP